MSIFTAWVNVIDRDYNSFAGVESFQVDSWDEAVSICNSNTWSGEKYLLESIMNNKSRKFIHNRQEYLIGEVHYEKQ